MKWERYNDYNSKYWNKLADLLVYYCGYNWYVHITNKSEERSFRFLSDQAPNAYAKLKLKEINKYEPFSDCYNILNLKQYTHTPTVMFHIEKVFKEVNNQYRIEIKRLGNRFRISCNTSVYWHTNVVGAFINFAHDTLPDSACIMHKKG